MTTRYYINDIDEIPIIKNRHLMLKELKKNLQKKSINTKRLYNNQN
jgi:hypothetical protein